MMRTMESPVNRDEADEDVIYIGQRLQRREQEQHEGHQLAEWASILNAVRGSRSRRASVRSGTSETPSELDHQARIEDILEDDIAEVIDLTGDDDVPIPPQSGPSYSGAQLSEYRLPGGFVLRRGLGVELTVPYGPYNARYLRIISIFCPTGSLEVHVRGLAFTRTRELRGMLPPKLNEVALIAELRSWDRRAWEHRAAIEVPARNILCAREIRVTNAPFPAYRFDRSSYGRRGRQWIEENGPLVCRYRFEISYHGDSNKPYEWAFVAVGEHDADPEFSIPDRQNMSRWRGGKIPGGSYNPNGPRYSVFDVDSGISNREHRLYPGQQYTAGDVFAGGGGASRGMERAGAKLIFAVDHWMPAVASLRRNFPNTRVYDMEVTDFINIGDLGHVDLLHLSPPCQFWSPAHTVPGKNDEANMAVLFSCTHLIEKLKPRVFTVEQTFGILSRKFEEFFNTFLSGFTKLGYSVRWKVVPLANFGVPQLRRRLIMIGAAPGERLPPFPATTHSKDGVGGLQPWTTPQAALQAISEDFKHPLHDVRRARFSLPRPPWDPTKLAKTITCAGGQNYHWSGTRDFTLLEYAVLQGFPKWHRFEGGSIKKQIGNAFAPSVVRLLYDHLIKWLLVQDGFDPSVPVPMPRSLSPGDYVVLGDSENGDDDNDGYDNRTGQEYDYAGELMYLGSRRTLQRLSEAAEVDRMRRDAEMVDDLSDTETVRGDPNPEEGDVILLI